MTDDLDTRIRSLVATAVADAPPAPEIDEMTIRTAPSTGARTDGGDGGRRWIAGGLAGLSVAAAIVALFLVSRPEEVSSPVIPATQPPTIAATTPEPGDELTEDPVVEVEPVANPFTPTVLYVGENGLDGVDTDGQRRALIEDEVATAVLTDDGVVFTQLRDAGNDTAVTTILMIEPDVGAPVLFPLPDELATGRVLLQDTAEIDGEKVVLVIRAPANCAGGNDCLGQVAAWWPGSGEVRIVDERNVFEGGWERLTLADNGLVVGTAFESASHEFFAAVVPNTPATGAPSAAELELEDFYFDCATCPNAFTTDTSGTLIGWLETDSTTGDLTLVVLDVDQRVDRVLTGFGDDGPPAPFATGLVMPFTFFEGSELGGSVVLNSTAIDPPGTAATVDASTGVVESVEGTSRLVFP